MMRFGTGYFRTVFILTCDAVPIVVVVFFAVFWYCTLAVVFVRTVEIVRCREGECYVVNGRLDDYMMYPYKTV